MGPRNQYTNISEPGVDYLTYNTTDDTKSEPEQACHRCRDLPDPGWETQGLEQPEK